VLEYRNDPTAIQFYKETCIGPLYTESEGLWWRTHQGQKLLIVPNIPPLRHFALEQAHNTLQGGHFGRNRTLKSLQLVCWWPNMWYDTQQYVATCATCQRDKPSNTHPAGLLQPLPIPGRRWESVSMDLITQLPKSLKGHDAIVVFVDRLTKMVHLAPTTTTATAQDIAHLFAECVWKHHGLPRAIVSDRDSRFTSEFAVELCRIIGIQQLRSTAFHPQTDGQTERANRVLEEYLRHFVNPTQTNWDTLLAAAEFAMNNAFNESIRTTPFMLNYGQHPLTPLNMDLDTPNLTAHNFVSRLKDAVRQAQQYLADAQQRQRRHANKQRKDVVFAPGSHVLLNTKNLDNLGHKGSTKKLLPKWVGPFTILERIGVAAYRLQLPENWRIHPVFHASLLKQWNDNGEPVAAPPLVLAPALPEQELEAILDHKPRKPGKKPRYYLVKWQGCGPEHNSWEKATKLSTCQKAVDEYWAVREATGSRREPLPER
jgi:hypothetical protein